MLLGPLMQETVDAVNEKVRQRRAAKEAGAYCLFFGFQQFDNKKTERERV